MHLPFKIQKQPWPSFVPFFWCIVVMITILQGHALIQFLAFYFQSFLPQDFLDWTYFPKFSHLMFTNFLASNFSDLFNLKIHLIFLLHLIFTFLNIGNLPRPPHIITFYSVFDLQYFKIPKYIRKKHFLVYNFSELFNLKIHLILLLHLIHWFFFTL